MNQINLFSYLARKKITPNEYAMLFNIANSITIDKSLEVDFNYLRMCGLIIRDNSRWTVTNKGKAIINQVDTYFVEQTNKKLAKRLDTSDLDKMVKHLYEMYPIKSIDNRYLRTNKKDVKDKLRKFFTKYDTFDFALVYDAVVQYLKEQEENDHKYTMSINYFIFKNGHSKLADYCQLLETQRENQ